MDYGGPMPYSYTSVHTASSASRQCKLFTFLLSVTVTPFFFGADDVGFDIEPTDHYLDVMINKRSAIIVQNLCNTQKHCAGSNRNGLLAG